MQKIGRKCYIIRTAWILFILQLTNNLYNQDTLTLAYGEKLHLGPVAKKYDFELMRESNVKFIKSAEFDDYIFSPPGIYRIRTMEIMESKYFGKRVDWDEFESLPPIFHILVDSISIQFDPSSLSFSESFRVGEKLDNVKLTIDCDIRNFYQSAFDPLSKKLEVKATGIGAQVHGNLQEVLKLVKPFQYRFIYLLSGIFSQRGYIQFDFEKYNGKTFSIGYYEEIK